MEDRTTGYFSGLSIISLLGGVGFLCVSLILWWFLRYRALVLFGVAMLCGGLANSLACFVLHRMDTAGYEVGYWRWFPTDLGLYSEYWRTAPTKGWSRLPLAGAVLCFSSRCCVLVLNSPLCRTPIHSVKQIRFGAGF